MIEDAKGSERSRGARSGIAIGGILTLVALVGGGITGLTDRSTPPPRPDASTEQIAATATAPSESEARSGPEAEPPGEVARVEPIETPTSSGEPATFAAAPASPMPEGVTTAPVAVLEPLAARLVPLPVPRPPEFRSLPSRAPRTVARQAPPVAAAPPEDTRSFVEKLFGLESPAPPRLAYAALETKPIDDVFRRGLNVVPRGGGVAIYDVRARMVTLPNGEKLEAHSGLGESMDDPAHAHVRMKGPTPVGTYDITEREQPFHGVRALRLHPVGGPEAVHGRVGLLAHSYMLGASGASNGCVSFRDYDKFLQAYLRGEVQRIVVVAGG